MLKIAVFAAGGAVAGFAAFDRQDEILDWAGTQPVIAQILPHLFALLPDAAHAAGYGAALMLGLYAFVKAVPFLARVAVIVLAVVSVCRLLRPVAGAAATAGGAAYMLGAFH